MKENTNYKRLVERYLSKKASDEELMVFFQLLKEGRLDNYLSEAFLDAAGIEEESPEKKLPSVLAALPPEPRFRISRLWVSVAVAASLTGIISLSIFLFSDNRPIPQKQTGSISQLPVPPQDLPPGGNRATLILSDGSSIILDSADKGQLAEQGGTKILKLDSDRLVYEGNANAPAAPVSYNIISTPRGGQYQVTLPDGSRVWLNAASSLRFPTAFHGRERIVELDGECYFEVAHISSMPFLVKMKRGVNIQVIGTHFNIHGYDNEPVKTTLLEGSVKVRSEHGAAILKPGQEASVKNSGELNIVTNADPEQAIAWKNGLFQFNRANISTIMRQIERWYDVEVVFQGEIPDKEFVGKVPRNSNLSEVLQVLEMSKIHFRIEGRKIIVIP